MRNLEYTTIQSPVDGVVVKRLVNIGQTVVSSMSASSLFYIATDLSKLKIWAAVNEADIGSIRKGRKSCSPWTPSPAANSREQWTRYVWTPP